MGAIVHSRQLERDVTPVVKHYDHDDTYPEPIVEQMKMLGLFGATIAAEHGGLGLAAASYAIIAKQWVKRTPV